MDRMKELINNQMPAPSPVPIDTTR